MGMDVIKKVTALSVSYYEKTSDSNCMHLKTARP